MEKMLSEPQLKKLREKGAIKENEIAYQAGDLIVAEDVITRNRRVINQSLNDIIEEKSSSRRILKG